MLKRFKIDSLLLFLVLALVLLWMAFPTVKTAVLGLDHFTKIEVDFEEKLNYPQQGITTEGNIELYNKNLTLLYSLNGGANYQKADKNQIDLNKIQNVPILYKNTSIRWRHPKGDFATVKTVQVKIRDTAKKTESQSKSLTYFNSTPSDLPIISLTINQADLFSWTNGVMVAGEESSYDDGFQKDWWFRAANFASRGNDWGRKSTFQYFEKGKLIVEQNCQLKISGNATRYFPQKSLKLFPLDAQNKKTKIDFAFFGKQGNKKATSLLLRHSGNDNNKTLFADLLMHQLANGTNVLVQNGFAVNVFINGNYWGVYNFRERIDAYFIAKKEGAKEKNITICEALGNGVSLKEGKEKERAKFELLIANLPIKKQLTETEYDNLKKEISLKSFIDYMIFETYYANQDWMNNNAIWYKEKDKKWKWILNDLDLALAYKGANNVNANLFNDLKNNNSILAKLFNSLMTNENFKTKFKNRTTEILADYLSEERIKEESTFFKKRVESEINNQINRWRFIDSYQQWEKDCAKNVTFLLERRTIYLKQVDSL